MTQGSCHNCGISLSPLEPFSLGKLFVDKAGAHVWWGESPVPLTPAEKQVILTLARAGGRIIKRAILAEVTGYDGDLQSNIAAVYVSRASSKFRAIDPAFDRIETLRGEGLRWRMEDA